MTLYYPTSQNFVQKTLDAQLLTGATASLTLNNVTGIQNKPGVVIIDRVDANNAETETKREVVIYTAVSGNTLTGLTRNADSSGSDQDHAVGAIVEFSADVLWAQGILNLLDGTDAGIKVKTALYDVNGNEVIKTPATTSAVNEVTVTNSATGNAVQVSATGGDTNIDLKLVPKGTGGISDKNGDYLSPNHSMSRQAIINGNFDVWQRATSVTAVTDLVYDLADRWGREASADSGTFPTITQTRQAITPGDLPGSFYHYRVATNGAGSSYGNAARFCIYNKVENGTRYLAGNGKKITVSFWARSDVAGKKIGIGFTQNYGTGGSPTSSEDLVGTVLTLTTSWAKYTFTATTNTLAGKTFGTANDDALNLRIYQLWGTTVATRFSFATTSETFVGAGYTDIAQVQLCAGDVALPFQPKGFAQELLNITALSQVETGWIPYTPGLTNITLGDGTLVFAYAQIGKIVHVRGYFKHGTTTSVSGLLTFDLPVTAVATYEAQTFSCYILDSGANEFAGLIQIVSGKMTVKAVNSAGTYTIISNTSATVPMTWANNDYLAFYLTYQAA